MKKFMIMVLVCALLLTMMPTVFAAGSVSLKGPSTVRAGDTITVTFYAGGDDIISVNGSVAYDASQVTFNGITKKIGGTWINDSHGDVFLFHEDTLKAPLGGSQAIFSASFTVKDVPADTEIQLSFKDVRLSNGQQDTKLGTKTHSMTVLPPLSGNCSLSGLTVSNAEISPAFSPDVTSYSASVPFTTSKLEVEAAAEHQGATVSIKNTSLAAGETTAVKVIVKAENGAEKTYTIRVKREQDPNYVPSSNAMLQELTPEGVQLSPAFSPDVTQYYVWLPYEADSLTLAAKAQDGKAKVQMDNTKELVAGQRNDIAVTVTAEDGTVQTYTVTAVRAPEPASTEAYLAGHLSVPVEPEPQPTEPEPTVTPTEEPTQPETPATPAAPVKQEPAVQGIPMVILAGACAACLLLGLLVGVLVARRRQEYLPAEETEEAPDFSDVPDDEPL